MQTAPFVIPSVDSFPLKGLMPMKKLSIVARASLLAASVALLLPLAVSAQNLTFVNGKPVPKARVDTLLQQATKSGQPRTPELEVQVKDEVVLREMFMQEAERRGLTRSADYKAQMELARQSILIRELFIDYNKNNPVSDAEIQTEYDKYKAQTGGTEVRASHILVDKEEEAKALIAQLKAGAKFDDLAKKNSKDAGSGQNGGDLDWAKPDGYVPEFAKAVTALKKGEMTETPVKSQFGYHIIKLDDTRQAQFASLEEVKPRIQQALNQQRIAKFRDDIKAKSKTDYKFSN
jgi:peptidyl-prolyl cis-trans isomerase C